jgi:predicted dehydrogenase
MKFTRRGFLSTAAAGVLPARLAAYDGLNFLAIGVGGRGSSDALAASRYGHVVACCDVDSAQIDAFLGKLAKGQTSKPDQYKDYRKALERKDIDAVTIGTPDHWHTPILLAALQAGKDVYCEKPLTLTIDEGKRICRAVRESKRVVQVGTQQRTEFAQRFLKAVAIARSGRLGTRLHATCSIGAGPVGGPFPVLDPPPALDWDFWLGQAPKVPYAKARSHSTFRWWFEYSGGKMTDWGAHHIDIAQWALGVENTGPMEIQGEGVLPSGRDAALAALRGENRAPGAPNSYNTATTFKIELKYASGTSITVQDGPDNGIRLAGSSGQIWVSRKELTGDAVSESARLDEEVLKLYRGKAPATHMKDFVDCVQDRTLPVSDVFTHHRSVTTCHLCNIALVLGRKLKWDPDREDFVGDAEASALCSRKQRGVYGIEA